MLRISAVRVINPVTGKSTLIYAQHDTASQTTLISNRLSTGEEFSVKNTLVVPNFSDHENVLPHSVDIVGRDNFHNVEIPTVPGRKSIDVLIGQADKKSAYRFARERER